MSMGAEEASWFMMEISTAGAHLHRAWDDATSDPDSEPDLSFQQLKLLKLLTSPGRSLNSSDVMNKCEQLFPFHLERGRVIRGILKSDKPIFGGSEHGGGYDCLFPHHGCLEGDIPRWSERAGWDQYMPRPHSPSFLMNIVLPLGEERFISMDRFARNQPLYRDAPLYISNSCMHSGKTARGLSYLSIDVGRLRHFC
jgi:hypothetical protein